MPYTMEDFRRDVAREYLDSFPPEELAQRLWADERLKRFFANKVLQRFSADEILQRLSLEKILSNRLDVYGT